MDATADTIYTRLGHDTLFALSARFYELAAADPLIGPMLPVGDIDGAAERQALFFVQIFGGPAVYSQRRGHPRLRARHLEFPITPAARDAWIRHMTAAMDELEIGGEEREQMLLYFGRTATFLINSPEAS